MITGIARYLVFTYLLCLSFQGSGQSTSYYVNTATTVIDGEYSPFNQVKGGDTIFLEAGQRDFILLRNIHGEPGKPIIIMNIGGVVFIDTDHYYGISVQGCSFIRLSGTGDPSLYYGIRIDRVENGGGIGVGEISSDFEIDHIQIRNCLGSGIVAKTDPQCNPLTTRGYATQDNTSIHNNFIDNVGNEGMYIGSTKYFGQTIQCNGHDTLVMPQYLRGVKVYDNIVMNTGMDGIQVSSAILGCQIHDNIIMYDSQREIFGQMSGIIVGGGSKCDCYNNLIDRGKGNGIEVHGLGGLKLYNNIILEPGKTFLPEDMTKMRYGFYIDDVSTVQDSSYLIFHNTIIDPKSDGIRFVSVKSRNNRVLSNLIINPGNYDFYENGATSYNGEDAYVMLPNSETDMLLDGNFFSRDINEADVSGLYCMPAEHSPLVDQASVLYTGISDDFFHTPRPKGAACDIGAVEFDPASLGILDISSGDRLSAYPNPAMTSIRITASCAAHEKVTLEIYDELGRQFYRKENKSGDGSTSFMVDLTDFRAGLYFYTVRGTGWKESGRFIRIR